MQQQSSGSQQAALWLFWFWRYASFGLFGANRSSSIATFKRRHHDAIRNPQYAAEGLKSSRFWRLWLATLGIALSLLALSPAAQAALITFDDLNCGVGAAIADGYAGLNWDNFYCANGATAYGGNSGYNAGRVSGTNVAYNRFGDPAEVTVTAPGGTKFNLNSIYLTAAWNDGLVVTITAYRNGTAVSTTTHTLSATAPALVTLNLSQIDRVIFSSSGGTFHDGYDPRGEGTHFVMDNLDVTFGSPAPTSVPTLSEWGLLLLGAALGATALRRRAVRR